MTRLRRGSGTRPAPSRSGSAGPGGVSKRTCALGLLPRRPQGPHEPLHRLVAAGVAARLAQLLEENPRRVPTSGARARRYSRVRRSAACRRARPLIRLPRRRRETAPHRLAIQPQRRAISDFGTPLDMEQPVHLAPAVLTDHAPLPEWLTSGPVSPPQRRPDSLAHRRPSSVRRGGESSMTTGGDYWMTADSGCWIRWSCSNAWPPWCRHRGARCWRITGSSPRGPVGERPSCRRRPRPPRGRRRRSRAAGPGRRSCAGCLRSRSWSVRAAAARGGSSGR